METKQISYRRSKTYVPTGADGKKVRREDQILYRYVTLCKFMKGTGMYVGSTKCQRCSFFKSMTTAIVKGIPKACHTVYASLVSIHTQRMKMEIVR